MQVKQIATILNTTIGEITGETGVVQEDLGNIVDVGKQTLNSVDVEQFTKKLIDRIGRTIFVDREYKGSAPNLAVDSWEYGSVLQKVRVEAPDNSDNKSWSLTAGTSYDPFVFTPPTVSQKFYNKMTTFEVDISIPTIQVKSAFNSPMEMNRFFATIETRIRMKLTLDRDSLTMRTINNLIGEKIGAGSNVVNLLATYKTDTGITLTPAKAMQDKEFLRYAISQIMLYSDRMKIASTLYNDGGFITFTPKEYQKLIMLSQFANAMDVYLLSDTYHDNLLALNSYDTVPFWQGSGSSPDQPFSVTSNINIKTASGKTVNQTGVIATLFDRDAALIANHNPRVTTQFNAKAEFTNYFYKEDCSYLNDTNENCIVFVVASTT